MAYTYPETKALQKMSADQAVAFLKQRTLVSRRINELSARSFFADFLFPNRINSDGVVLYEVNAGEQSFYTNREAEAIAPGAEYPRAIPVAGALATAETTKWGQAVPITDEKIKISAMNEVDRGCRAVVNTVRRKVDTVSLTAASAAITKTTPAKAAWDTASSNPVLDVELALASIEDEEQGYSPDTLVVTSVLYAQLASRFATALQGDGANRVAATGIVPDIGGLTVVPVSSARMPAGVAALVLDRQVFGALAYNDLPSPEFSGSSATGIETAVERDPDKNDSWLLRGRRVVVPVIQEPNAARKIVGA